MNWGGYFAGMFVLILAQLYCDGTWYKEWALMMGTVIACKLWEIK